ncbi:MAG: histidine--tRNA ligase [Lentisphaeria bacterium]
MAGKVKPLPGTADLWEPEVQEWLFLENKAREVLHCYGYGEVRTPILEKTDLFVRGLGDETEVVQKEMYTFEDRGGRSITLRPEGTAGIMRAIANVGLSQGEEKRVFSIGPMFRGERPAAGRRRQFHQIGVEAVGRCTPVMDAESIVMLLDYLAAVDITDTRLLLNTRGTAEDRKEVAPALEKYFRGHIETMCSDCQRRLEGNVWRILDCKNEECQPIIQNAPAIPELLGSDSKKFFEEVCRFLDRLGVSYELEPRLVRGLDYYEQTVFEVIHEGENLGAQNAVAGGGRYRISLPGSEKHISGVGFALGMERLMLARAPELVGTEPAGMGKIDIFVGGKGENARVENLKLARELRENRYRVLVESENRSLKAQFRTADKVGATVVLLQAESELAKNVVACRNMDTAEQSECPREKIVDWVKDNLDGDL